MELEDNFDDPRGGGLGLVEEPEPEPPSLFGLGGTRGFKVCEASGVVAASRSPTVAEAAIRGLAVLFVEVVEEAEGEDVVVVAIVVLAAAEEEDVEVMVKVEEVGGGGGGGGGLSPDE